MNRSRPILVALFLALAAAVRTPAADPATVRAAIANLAATYGPSYPRASEFRQQLDALEKTDTAGRADAKWNADLVALQREALLAHPRLDFARLLLVKRHPKQMGLPNNWDSNSSIPKAGYDNELAVLSPVRPDGALTTLFKPEGGRFVGDTDLHFDSSRLLFSMPADKGRWQVFEIGADGANLRQLPLIEEPDVDNYDACYLPDGAIIFTSTAPFVGVPCVTGSSHVSNLYRYDPATGTIRRLGFEQDHDWGPTVLEDGRVLYLRWEYADLPHFVSRILFTMNPDGTNQREFYGSNSYWPNSMFYARPIPGNPARFVAVISGHHDTQRMGELVLFDAARGRLEAGGAVQRIPGRGKKVEPVIRDDLVRASWPKFLHPWPLDGTTFLVSCQPTPQSKWGLYLADTFDNLVLVKESDDGAALLEPVPLRATAKPPVLPSQVRPERKDALVQISDIYTGPGLAGVPRGSVKKLRIIGYQFAYHGMGGQINRVGLDGPWDVKRIHGTVPVEADGSAFFRVPANTPLALQPLDADGAALQLMRSWLTAMPGEVLSCVGCHERQNSVPPPKRSLAAAKPPAELAPWYGPARGFSFRREVQPVLDRHCVRCHDGHARPDTCAPVDLRAADYVSPVGEGAYRNGSRFTPSYLALRPFVRGPTMESDMHLLMPLEVHAGTTRLIQLLRAGHQDVRLDAESMDRLITWIDLNTPMHGTWTENVGPAKVEHQRARRLAMDLKYANLDTDPEAEAALPPAQLAAPVTPVTAPPAIPPSTAQRPPAVLPMEGPATRTVDLGGGLVLELVRIPAGEFVMGDPAGARDAQPASVVKIAKAFWMGRLELSNTQYAQFDPQHDSRLENGDFLQFSVRERGYPGNLPAQPVVRVSWQRATEFCRWLSQKSGLSVDLPTEAQWEWACRAGTTTPLWYGDAKTDFSPFANLADHSLYFIDTYGWGLPSGAIPPRRPTVPEVKDGHHVTAPCGTFKPNPWGLCDMHGNAAEWTRSLHAPYPYADDARNDPTEPGLRVVRGGSWFERPFLATSAARLAYPPWQSVFNVGFRVVVED